MPKLTHVKTWNDGKWKSIAAEDVQLECSTSHNSGLFMCDLCKQMVNFIAEGNVSKHFKHAKNNHYSQNCPDYTGNNPNNDVNASFNPKEYQLPIRLTIIEGSGFKLEMGFPPILNAGDDNIKISICGKDTFGSGRQFEGEIAGYNSEAKYEYLATRLGNGGITYLSIGNNKWYPSYDISLSRKEFGDKVWPSHVEGIMNDFGLFDYHTRKKIPYNTSIYLNKDYYLLASKPPNYSEIDIQEVHRQDQNIGIWKICIKSAEKWIIEYFLKNNYVLGEDYSDMSFQAIWPAFVETSAVLLKPKGKITFYIKGNVTFKGFPSVNFEEKPNGKQNVITFEPNSREQLIAIGEHRVLDYVYLWDDALDMSTKLPTIEVTDSLGIVFNGFNGGESDKHPYRNTLKVKLPYDGFFEIIRKGVIRQRGRIEAEKCTEVIELQKGDDVKIYIGLDLIWSCHFVSKKRDNTLKHHDLQISDERFYQILRKCNDATIRLSPILHEWTDILIEYPKTRHWLLKQIRHGNISKKAFAMLKEHIQRRNKS